MDINWNDNQQEENPEDKRLKEIISSAVSNSVRVQIELQKNKLSGTVETISATLEEVRSAHRTLKDIYRAHNEDLQRAGDLVQQLTAAADRQEQTIAQLDSKISALSSTIEQAQAAQAQAAQEKAQAQAAQERAQQAQEEADKAVARAKELTRLQDEQDQIDRDYDAQVAKLTEERTARIQAIDKELADL